MSTLGPSPRSHVPGQSIFCWAASVLLWISPAVPAQVAVVPERSAMRRALATNIVIPQARSFSSVASAAGFIKITSVDVGVAILGQVATTTLDINLTNDSSTRQEAEVLLPVPEGCVVRGFTFQGAGSEPTARLLDQSDARHLYDEIVAKIRDPALLEFAGYNLVRSSVFPIDAHGRQKVRLIYETVLAADGARRDFVLPRSEALGSQTPWNIAVTIEDKAPICSVYSPSHKIEITRQGERRMLVRTANDAAGEPGPFRLSYLLTEGEVAAALFAYPDPKVGGGYFLLLAGLPAAKPAAAGAPTLKREVTLVLDRSGSMHGEKIEQAVEAARQVLSGLEEGEAFNLIIFNDAVQSYSPHPVIKSRKSMAAANEFLKTVRACGGTNLHDALAEVLRQKPTPGTIPLVLFLTDGQPTTGQTSESAIGDLAAKANPFERRIFTFGVGVDVNAPLLDRLASLTRASSAYVLPREDVEAKIGQVFKRLHGPVLAGPILKVLDGRGEPAAGRVRDMLPASLPDVFEGDQVLVLGQYLGDEPLHFELTGNYLGRQRTFRFDLPLTKATTRNGFVSRLWAGRKINTLVEAIRQSGADKSILTLAAANSASRSTIADPKIRELVGEVVRLSKEFGVMTEYTAFLAQEGTNLGQPGAVLAQAERNFFERAIQTRSGSGGVNQSLNTNAAYAPILNTSNSYYDPGMNRVSVAAVQQVSDLAFYRRGGRWVDSRMVENEAALKPKRTVEFGSPEFHTLVDRLTSEGRQGAVSLTGDIVLSVDGEPVLIRAATPKP